MKYSIPEININLFAIKKNYLYLKKLCNKTEVASSVKASSYGLGGQKKIIQTLKSAGCKNFFVAQLSEGIILRKLFKNIHINVLNGLLKGEEKIFFKYQLTPILNDYSQFQRWNKFLKNKKKNRLIIHFDTGMCRLGVQSEDAKKLFKQIQNIRKYKYVLIMSHLASSSNIKDKYNNIQRKRFEKIKKDFSGFNYSLASTGGIYLGKKFHYDMVRPGINLYGGYQFCDKNIKNVVSMRSPIIAINKLKKGETCGYNQTYRAKKDMFTATIPMGYADGFGLRLSNKGFVFFKGNRLRMIGRISMDTIIIDITNIKKLIKIGDFVEIYNDKFTIDKFAKLTGTIPYRVICCISDRFTKNYLC